MDDDYFKKLELKDEEKHAASLTEDLCKEEDKIAFYEANDTSIMNGSIDNSFFEASKDEYETTCLMYDKYGDMKEETSFPMYAFNDNMESTAHLFYDMDDNMGMIVTIDDELGVDEPKHDENLVWHGLPFEDDFISWEEEKEGTKVIDENLYEHDTFHESHHYTIPTSELIHPLGDISHNTDEMTLYDLESRLLITKDKIV